MPTPQENGLATVANNVEAELEKIYGQRMGFAMIIFCFGSAGIGDYISNGRREDIIEAMREAADRLENKEDIPVTKGAIQ